MTPSPTSLALAAAGAALATLVLARLAPRLGLVDDPAAVARDARRKRQRRPVPAVGGAAVLLGLACAGALPPAPAPDALWGAWLPGPAWVLASLGALLVLGTWDDRVGLRAAPKAAGQLVACAPLAWGCALENGALAAAGLLVLALAAVNVLNTFDNADGALAGLGLVGFGAALSPVGACCLGFLPFNLDAGRARNRAARAPSAYLGDSGAFVLALLCLATPASAGLLVLPALDLGRLALLRWRAGSRPWIGDRRHLAHRLEARGLGRPAVALVLALVGGPACVLVAVGAVRGSAGPCAAGVALTAALFVLALWLAPEAAERDPAGPVPCPPPGSAE